MRVVWYAFDVDVSSDGKHLVRWGPWPRLDDVLAGQTLALSFYENGREIKKYRVKDLIARPKYLPSCMSHYQWLKESTFDDKRNRLTVLTLKGYGGEKERRYVFDVTSGSLVSATLSRPSKTRRRQATRSNGPVPGIAPDANADGFPFRTGTARSRR